MNNNGYLAKYWNFGDQILKNMSVFIFSIIKYLEKKVMLSQSSLNKIQNFDIVCIGNYAAIVADRIYQMHNSRYTIALLEFKKKSSQPSLSGLGSVTFKINGKPKGADIFKQKVKMIHPQSKTIVLDNGKKLTYKFLVYGRDNYNENIHEHALYQALSNPYSKVYSNLSDHSSIEMNFEGTSIFYVPEGPGKFRQNFPFLQIAFQNSYNQNFEMIIMLQGDSFFPNCHKAHLFLEETLRDYKINIIYGVKLIKIDYLRRKVIYQKGGLTRQLVYETFYCFIKQEQPLLLKQANINPLNCNHRLIHNYKYDSIYIIAEDIFPTTMSRQSMSIQIHHTVHNIARRLQASDKKKRISALAAYDGATSFQIRINRFSSIQFKHSYQDKSFSMSIRGCLHSLFNKCMQELLTKQYLNFKNYGLPHYFWPPQPQQTQLFQKQLQQQSQNTIKCDESSSKKQ